MNSPAKTSLTLVFTLLVALLVPTVAQAATVKLTVTKTGIGAGTVTSSPAGINCGATCSFKFTTNTNVTLTAAASAGSKLSAWTGACTGTATTCTVAMSAAKAVTANFVTVKLLTLTKAGTGAGTVTSAPAGINCGATCSFSFTTNTSVTLTAAPSAGSTFTSWTGACTGTTTTCTVAMSAAKAVTATFTAIPVQLTITKAGTGAGTITSTPAGISCGATCTANFNQNASVTLTAAPTAGSTFTGWTGACTGTATTCTVAMTAAKAVTATFTAIPVQLTVTKSGTGTGTITSTPAGINCGAACSANFNQGSTVTLTATATAGSAFTGWTGACTGTTSTCTVTLSAAQSVTANFNTVQVGLTVTKSGTGAGTITSTPAGIDCGATCTANFNQGSTITLTATPSAGSAFDGWTGACTGTTATCTVTMSQAQTATANFTLIPLALTISTNGTGTGTITSTPAGINCGATCSANFAPNTAITLTATPTAGSTFTSWTGACAGTTTTCTVTLSAAQSVSASFALAQKTFTVSKSGSGTGTISSSPAGIDCGPTCAFGFAPNSSVTLTATPASDATFQGWHGACSGTSSTCTVTLSQAQTAYAEFAAPVTSTYQYDPNGNLTQTIDPLGHNRQTQYDSLDQAVRQLEPDPAVNGSTLGQIDTDYDGLGQVTKVTDPRNLQTNYQMDSLGNLLSQSSPDTGSTQNTYDEAGNLKARTDARGKVATYSYDSQNRLTQVVYDDQTITYTWDTCSNGIGRLCGLANGNSTLAFNYDSHGRITSKTQTIGTIVQNTAYGYNTQGQLIQTATPGGNTLGYAWQNDRVQSVTVNAQPLIDQITYEPDGQIAGWTWSNGSTSERFYDLTGKPTAISLGMDTQGQLPTLRNYSYDASGKVTGIFDDITPALDQAYGYDNLDRLISNQQGAFTLTSLGYSYDLSGNRTSKTLNNTTAEASAIDPGSNRLQQKTGTQTTTYSYDPAGNLISDGTITYGHNDQGRRTSATATNLNATYAYNALGQRSKKTVNGTSTLFAYDEQGQLQGEYNATGQLVQETVWLGNMPLAVLKPNTSQSTIIDIAYIHGDHLGAPRKIARPSDNKALWTWEPEAFGNSLPDENPGNLGSFTYNLRFPGQYYDQETGLHYNYFRDYDPSNGRYVTSDPIGLAGGINTYAYVGGNPVNYTDRLGLQTDVFDPGQPYYPGPIDILIPGTPANNAWVDAVTKLIQMCKPEDRCDKEWREARQSCRDLIYEQMQQRAGRRKKRSVIGVTGGYTDVEECARGLVSEQCGGNMVTR